MPHSEDGATLPLVVLSMFVVFGMALLTVDAGALWTARRTLATASDAGALAAASSFADGGNGCDEAKELADANSPSSFDSCLPQVDVGGGYVTVKTSSEIPLKFGALFDLGAQRVRSTSTAMYSSAGVRPFGICAQEDFMKGFSEIGWEPPQDVQRVVYSNATPDLCAGGEAVPGGWPYIDFNAGSADDEFVYLTLKGYPGAVGVNDCYANGTGSKCEIQTGSKGQTLDDALTELVEAGEQSGKQFPVVIFDNATGNGTHAQLSVVEFRWVRLVNFGLQGSQADPFFGVQIWQSCKAGPVLL